MSEFWYHIRRNSMLTIGVITLLLMVVLWLVGYFAVDIKNAAPLSAPTDLPPSREHPLGTDSAGRELLAVMVAGAPTTLQIGLIAGSLGMIVGTILGFTAGYFGGVVDAVVRSAADVALTVPALAVLVVIASVITKTLSPEILALIIAALAWMWPTRTIRSQVLTMRERAYVEVARLNGLNNREIIFKELMPNLLPYLAASFVGAVSSAVLAAIGLEALGLGPQSEPTLGMTIYWARYYNGLPRGMWWWWAPPVLIIIFLFIALFMIAAGLDEIANPRARRTT
ncbi:MAG TPA: ABC transporter permease [Caldilineaceae bacterium]|nr:ABC transporter permease [Caldilineaceae bacterium]HRW07053.1 ABC transporter permease [Caldilineaceae bacterium]